MDVDYRDYMVVVVVVVVVVVGFVELVGKYHETALVAFLFHYFSGLAPWILFFVLYNTCWTNSKKHGVNKTDN